ncbi:hypothetical protein QL285_020384 [Trifolium repens]|nr:hypothetical protein QL285_020384 [Trifolium repens]
MTKQKPTFIFYKHKLLKSQQPPSTLSSLPHAKPTHFFYSFSSINNHTPCSLNFLSHAQQQEQRAKCFQLLPNPNPSPTPLIYHLWTKTHMQVENHAL